MRWFAICLLTVVVMCGCERRRQAPTAFATADDSQYVLTILLDLSGSFQHQMTEDGKAYEFLMKVLDHYFRDRIGTDDKLIVGQISGDDHALLWQGTPMQLRRDFPSAHAFREFLNSRANPNASLVHDSLAHTVEYVLRDPSVAGGRSKSAILVLSDLLDTSSQPESRERVVQALESYGRTGGAVGLYYVDQLEMTEWEYTLQEAGIREVCVESEIVGTPTLPTLE